MNISYLIAGGGGLVALLLFAVVLLVYKKHRSKPAPTKHRGGLTLSGNAFKDERLGADFILSNIEAAVVMVGPDNQIHLFNPAASKITGWPAEEAVGLGFHKVLQLLDGPGRPYELDGHPFSK